MNVRFALGLVFAAGCTSLVGVDHDYQLATGFPADAGPDATTPSSEGGVAPDAEAGSPSPEGGSPRFCDGADAGDFCADFEGASVDETWTGREQTGTGTLAFFDPGHDGARALAVTVPDENNVDLTTSIPSAIQHHLVADFWVDVVKTAPRSAGLVSLITTDTGGSGVPPSIGLTVSSTDATFVVHENETTATLHPASEAVPGQTWVHVVVTLDFTTAPARLKASFHGTQVLDLGLPAVFHPGMIPSFKLGLYYTDPGTGTWEVHYDDVVFHVD